MKTIDKSLSRRNFIRLGGLTGAALTIGYAMPAWAKGKPEIFTGEEATNLGIELTSFVPSVDETQFAG